MPSFGEAMLLLSTESALERRTMVTKIYDGLPRKKIESGEDGINDDEGVSCGGGVMDAGCDVAVLLKALGC